MFYLECPEFVNAVFHGDPMIEKKASTDHAGEMSLVLDIHPCRQRDDSFLLTGHDIIYIFVLISTVRAHRLLPNSLIL